MNSVVRKAQLAYIYGLVLRSTLILVVVGFGAGDLAMGTGLVTAVLGATIVAFAGPVHLLVLKLYSLEARTTKQ